MAKKQIYLLFSCDSWKSNMKLVSAATTLTKLKSAVIREIHAGNMHYNRDGRYCSITQQIRNFREDFNNVSRELLNNGLSCGFMDYTLDGEEY